jgi:hypothetical protein
MKNTFKLTLAIALIAVISMVSFASEKDGSKTASAAVSTMNMTGTIIDADTQETLAGVTVKIEGTGHEVKTDLDGNFTIEGLVPGEYKLEVSYISYKESKFVKNLSVSDNDGLQLSLKSE